MHQESVLLRSIAVCLIVLALFFSGCSTPSPPPLATGSVQVTSSPEGAEVYLDQEYRGTTPATLMAIPAGNHLLEVRERGYERWVTPLTVDGSAANITVALVSVPPTLPVTVVTAKPGITKTTLPQIHIDGYWTWPASASASTGNPTPLLVHIDSFNVGYADAREVTVSANLYYQTRQICWNTIYLGTLKAGSHVTKDTMVYCTLPSSLNSPDLTIRFENVVVTP